MQIKKTKLNIIVTKEEKTRNNIILLKVAFTEKLDITPLQIIIETKKPYRSMDYEGIPLQNWKHTIDIDSYYVDNTEEGTIGVSVTIIVISIVFSLLFLFYYFSPYLLVSLWEYTQLFYLMFYINVQWPSAIGPFFQTFSFSHLRWKIFTNPEDNIIFSPEKYYIESDDMSLLPNIGWNLIICLTVTLFMALCKVLSFFEWKLSNICMNTWKSWKCVLLIVLFLIYSNILIYASINAFYSPPDPLFNSFTFWTFLSILILIAIIPTLIILFRMQWNDKNALDNGINPEKKRIIIALPLYKILRRIVLIFSLTIYSSNPAFMVCLTLISTAFIFTLIYWYQPFTNETRYKCTLVEEATLFLFLLFVFVYVLNPSLSPSYCNFLIFWAFLLTITTLIYPSYCLYCLKRRGERL